MSNTKLPYQTIRITLIALMIVLSISILGIGILLGTEDINVASAFTPTGITNSVGISNGTFSSNTYNCIYIDRDLFSSYSTINVDVYTRMFTLITNGAASSGYNFYYRFQSSAGRRVGLSIVIPGYNYATLSSDLNTYVYNLVYINGSTIYTDNVLLLPPYLTFYISNYSTNYNFVKLGYLDTSSTGSVDPSEYVTIEEYNQLNSLYQSVSSQLTQLQSDYSTLSSDYADLQSSYTELETSNTELSSMLSESQLNLTQKTNQLNTYFDLTNELVAIVGGFYYPDDLELIDWLVENGYLEDEDQVPTMEIWFQVLADINEQVEDLVANKNIYDQFYEDYQELLETYNALNGQYNALIDSLNFTSKSLLSIDKIDNFPGTTSAVSNGYILSANTTGQAKIRYNLGVTISANSEILLEYDFATNLYGGVQYPIIVNDGHEDIITFSSPTQSNTFTYTPDYDVSYLIISATNPVSTDSSVFLADVSVKARSFDLSVVIANAYLEGQESINQTAIYDRGFEDGKLADATDPTFVNMLTALVDMPINALFGRYDNEEKARVGGLFNFELLGVNLSSFYLSLLSIGLILFIMKICLSR